jgi:antigen flippase
MKTEDYAQNGSLDPGSTYGEILESSAVIGGSSAVTVIFGVIRTKLLAILLGPSGLGLFGVYGSIISVAECLAGVGVNSSAVRQIAHAASSGNPQQVARTSRNMFRVVLVLSVLGAAGLAALSGPISAFTFGGLRHRSDVALLSLAVFFELLSSGSRALLQGMRKVRDLASASIATAALGLLVTLPLVYFIRERGIAPSIVATGFLAFLVALYFRSKISIGREAFTWAQSFKETRALLKHGFVFMTS